MSNTPFGFSGRRNRRLEPFAVEPFGFGPRQSCPVDPFVSDPFSSELSFPRIGFGDNSAFADVADARVVWKETHEAQVSNFDLTARHKRGVQVEVEDGSAHQSKGKRACKLEKMTDTRHRVEREKIDIGHRVECERKTETRYPVARAKKTDTSHLVAREKKTDTRHRVEREKKTETWHRVEREKITETWHRVEHEKKTDTSRPVAREKKADSSQFLRRVRLPANVKADQVKVAVENRMLTVTAPKGGVKKPSGKSIKFSG